MPTRTSFCIGFKVIVFLYSFRALPFSVFPFSAFRFFNLKSCELLLLMFMFCIVYKIHYVFPNRIGLQFSERLDHIMVDLRTSDPKAQGTRGSVAGATLGVWSLRQLVWVGTHMECALAWELPADCPLIATDLCDTIGGTLLRVCDAHSHLLFERLNPMGCRSAGSVPFGHTHSLIVIGQVEFPAYSQMHTLNILYSKAPMWRCQTVPSIWTLGNHQPVIPGVPLIR